MGLVIRTDEELPWAKRVGGAYPTLEALERAAEQMSYAVLVGQPHPEHGYFMVMARGYDRRTVQAIIDSLLVAENDMDENPGDYAQIARWIAKRFGGHIPPEWRR